MNRKPAPMPLTAVGANIPQTLNVLLDLPAQSTLDQIIGVKYLVELRNLLLSQLICSHIGFDRSLSQNLGCKLGSNPMDVLQ